MLIGLVNFLSENSYISNIFGLLLLDIPELSTVTSDASLQLKAILECLSLSESSLSLTQVVINQGVCCDMTLISTLLQDVGVVVSSNYLNVILFFHRFFNAPMISQLILKLRCSVQILLRIVTFEWEKK